MKYILKKKIVEIYGKQLNTFKKSEIKFLICYKLNVVNKFTN